MKFHENCLRALCTILFTVKQTDRQTNIKHGLLHNLLAQVARESIALSVYTRLKTQLRTVPCSAAEVRELIQAERCVSMRWIRQRTSRNVSLSSNQSTFPSCRDRLHIHTQLMWVTQCTVLRQWIKLQISFDNDNNNSIYTKRLMEGPTSHVHTRDKTIQYVIKTNRKWAYIKPNENMVVLV